MDLLKINFLLLYFLHPYSINWVSTNLILFITIFVSPTIITSVIVAKTIKNCQMFNFEKLILFNSTFNELTINLMLVDSTFNELTINLILFNSTSNELTINLMLVNSSIIVLTINWMLVDSWIIKSKASKNHSREGLIITLIIGDWRLDLSSMPDSFKYSMNFSFKLSTVDFLLNSSFDCFADSENFKTYSSFIITMLC